MSVAKHSVELLLGQAIRVASPVAGRYSFDRTIAVIATDSAAEAPAQVLEAAALQLLAHGAMGDCELFLFEARASELFKEIKYLFAATQGELGSQWLSPREANTGLQHLNQRVMARASLLAAARQDSMAAYNAGRRSAEPLIFVVLSGLEALVMQDPGILGTLQHIAQQGPRCGVVLLLLCDLSAIRESPLQPAQRNALFAMLGNVVPSAFAVDFSGSAPVPYNIGEPYQRFARDFGYRPEITPQVLHDLAAQVLATRQARVAASPQQDFLRIRIGEAQANDAFFALGHASHAFNALISGGSGSGKTTFVQNLILSICEQHTPSQVELVLLDYGTVSFGPYRGVAHVQALVDTPRDGEKIAHFFTKLADTLHARKDTFKACGEQHNVTVDNMSTYARLSGSTLPHIVTVIDEFGSLLSNENAATATVGGRTVRVSAYAEQTINLLVREGRKVGMHLIVITQSFAKLDRMPQDLKSNPHLACALKAQEPRDSHAILSSENDAAYRIAPFQAVLNRHAGLPKQNVIVNLEYVSETDIAERQAALRARWPRSTPDTMAQDHKGVFADSGHAPVNEPPPARAEPGWLRPERAKSDVVQEAR